MSDAWYQFHQSDSTLCQGDILYRFPVLVPGPAEDFSKISDPAEVEFIHRPKDVIVMSQSCDLQQAVNAENWSLSVLLCPLADIGAVSKSKIDNIISDKMPSYHFLNQHKDENGSVDYHIVDFKEVYSIPLGVLNSWKFKNMDLIPRLKSPYVELMSQRFGLKIMRVGTDDSLKAKAEEVKKAWDTITAARAAQQPKSK